MAETMPLLSANNAHSTFFGDCRGRIADFYSGFAKTMKKLKRQQIMHTSIDMYSKDTGQSIHLSQAIVCDGMEARSLHDNTCRHV